MKSTLLLITLAASTLSLSAQFYAEPKLGLTSRLMLTAYADAGILAGKWNLAATGAIEQGMGKHAGALAGFMPKNVTYYIGYGYYFAQPTKTELVSRPYPIAGIQFVDPYGRAVVDFRYQINAFNLSMGVRLGRKD